MKQKNKNIPILVVEDSQEDFEVLQRAFKKAGFEMDMRRCKNGKDALDYLYKDGEYEGSSRDEHPPFILLDLNMPGMDGHALMETIKDDESFKFIPIIVLSTSASDDDIFRSYQNGASSYLKKPDDMSGYVKMVEILRSYWFECNLLPTNWGTA